MLAAPPRAAWKRFVAVSAYEQDPGFRNVIYGLSGKGLRVAGVIGLACMAFYAGIHLLVIGSTFTWTYTPADSGRVLVAWDKLLVVLLSLACVVLARTPVGRRWGRLFAGWILWTIAVAFVLDDVANGTRLFASVYLVVLMLVGIGALPFHPAHTFALCTAMVGMYFLALAGYPALWDPDWADTLTHRVIPLVTATIACTGISALVYRSRFEQYRALRDTEVLQKQVEVEQKLRTEAAELLANYLQAENERKSQELEAARRVQLAMLPHALPQYPGAEIAAHMHTATEVGGDYYDFSVSEDGALTFVIGDATGHGAAAGIMVTAMKTLWNAFADEADLELIMRKSSEALKRLRLPKLYMSIAFGRLREHTLELIGAGMPPALVCRAATGVVEEIALKGTPLGSPGHVPYSRQHLVLAPGDTVVLMSDGLPELRDGSDQMLGYERIPHLLAEAAGRSPDHIIAHLTETIRAWSNEQPPDDDVTLIVVRVRAVAEWVLQPIEIKTAESRISGEPPLP